LTCLTANIVNCQPEAYDIKVVDGEDEVICTTCTGDTALTEDKQHCVTPITGCSKHGWDSAPLCLECASDYMKTVTNICLLKEIANCKDYEIATNSDDTYRLDCAECNDNFITSTNKSTCLTAVIANCESTGYQVVVELGVDKVICNDCLLQKTFKIFHLLFLSFQNKDFL
jgi:hypothetical protein